MKSVYLFGVFVAATVCSRGAEDVFQMQSVPLSVTSDESSLPAVQILSTTIAAASSVTVDSCIAGNPGCPDKIHGHVSLPFPAAELPSNGGAYITWIFQDLSYTGTVEMMVQFVQNGVVISQTSDPRSKPSITAGRGYVVHFSTVVPAEASPGPAAVMVSVKYGQTLTRAAQAFTVTAPAPSIATGSGTAVPAAQVVSVTVAPLNTVSVTPCLGGTPECLDPTAGYASIPFPEAILPFKAGAYITYLIQDISYLGFVNITVAFVQNGVVVGQPSHFTGIGFATTGDDILTDSLEIPSQALPGPATVVVSLNVDGTITRASQDVWLQ